MNDLQLGHTQLRVQGLDQRTICSCLEFLQALYSEACLTSALWGCNAFAIPNRGWRGCYCPAFPMCPEQISLINLGMPGL